MLLQTKYQLDLAVLYVGDFSSVMLQLVHNIICAYVYA